MPATVLAYNLPTRTQCALERLCRQQGITLQAVSDLDQGKTVGALLGLPLPAAQIGNRPGTVPGEMLVLSAFTSQALEEFLNGFPAAGVPPIPLKAVVTAHNLTWTGVELYGELAKERRAAGR